MDEVDLVISLLGVRSTQPQLSESNIKRVRNGDSKLCPKK